MFDLLPCWVDKKGQSAGAPTTDVVTVEEDSQFVRLRRKNWARLIAKIWQVEPEICACCGEKMRVIAAITHPHQDDVIERILKSTVLSQDGLRDKILLREP